MRDFDRKHLRLHGLDNQFPVSGFFVDMLLFLGEQICKDRNPGEHYKYKHAAQTEGLHIANNLGGNLGRLAFSTLDGDVHGLGWVAPSTKAAVRIVKNASAYEDRTVVLLPTNNRKNRHIKATNNGNVKIFKPFFASNRRTHDSEYLLLNYLDHFLENNSTDIGGEVVLVTERVPCANCTGIISSFSQKFKNISLNIVYFYETNSRDATSLLCAIQGNVRVYKASMSARGADATQILETTPSHRIHEVVLEQSEEMDSSAHVNSRTEGIRITLPR
ncbi:MAG: deaminase domain-containing protein [Pseudomonadota bacterium]